MKIHTHTHTDFLCEVREVGFIVTCWILLDIW